jgi:uncharacterized protein GlcG (DUF336 family)
LKKLNVKTISLESISLEAASDIARNSLAHARSKNMAPIAVAVLDVRGTLKAFLAEDGTTLLRFDIAFGKAWGALGMGYGGRALLQRSANTPLFYNALQSMTKGKMVTVPGSVLIRNDRGDVVGSVGISGESSENDERCAVAGIKESGLEPDSGAPA